MSDTAILSRAPAPPRKRDAEATRAAILAAAKAQFARSGYDRAALRDIAAEAGADVALIKRYFGGKEALFTEALKASFNPDRLALWDRATFAQEMAVMMAGGAPTVAGALLSLAALIGPPPPRGRARGRSDRRVRARPPASPAS